MNKAVIFDLDNTLTHRNESIAVFSKRFAEDYRLKLEADDSNLITEIIESTDNGGYGHIENPYPTIKHSIAENLISKLKWKKKPSSDSILNYWREVFPECSVEMPGARETIVRLKELGYKVAVLSNGAEVTRTSTLKVLGLLPLIDLVVSSGTFGTNKPDPSIFHHTSGKLNVLAANCWFVGDHIINDFEGAEKSGMNAIWLEGFHTPSSNAELPDKRICALHEITQWLSETS